MYCILIVAAFAASLISGGGRVGGSLLLLPVVTSCVGAELAVPILTLAQLMGNLARMATGWKEIKWKYVGWFCVTALPLAALGAFGFSVFPKSIVSRCIGIALIVLVVFKLTKKIEFRGDKKTLLIGGGPIGAAVFLSLGLTPVSYIASEASTATAMHILKTVIYSKMSAMTWQAFATGLIMGLAMVAGTFAANRFIKKMDKNKFQKYVAVLLCIVGLYMAVFGG